MGLKPNLLLTKYHFHHQVSIANDVLNGVKKLRVAE